MKRHMPMKRITEAMTAPAITPLPTVFISAECPTERGKHKGRYTTEQTSTKTKQKTKATIKQKPEKRNKFLYER